MDLSINTLAKFQANRSQEDQVLGKIDTIDKNKQSSAEKIEKVAQDFESLFLDIVLKSMRQSVMKSGLIDGGNAEEIYRSMLDSEYSKIMAKQGMTGLSEMIEKQLMGKMHLSNIDVSRIAKQISGKKIYSQERLREGLKNQTIK